MLNGKIQWYAINTWCLSITNTIHELWSPKIIWSTMEHWTQFEIWKLLYCMSVAHALIKWMNWWVIICHMETLLSLLILYMVHMMRQTMPDSKKKLTCRGLLVWLQSCHGWYRPVWLNQTLRSFHVGNIRKHKIAAQI